MSNQLDGNESVYPLQHPNDNTFFNDSGITLRQYYAGLAMQGLLASYGNHDTSDFTEIASDSVYMADVIIEELNKTKTP